MPLYYYKCRECDHSFKEFLSMDDRKIPVNAPCPECKVEHSIFQELGYAGVVDPIRIGRKKPPSGFNEVLRNIKKGNPGSTVRIHD